MFMGINAEKNQQKGIVQLDCQAYMPAIFKTVFLIGKLPHIQILEVLQLQPCTICSTTI